MRGELSAPAGEGGAAGVALDGGYGGFTAGGMRLAVPMSALREVVPCHGLIEIPCPAAYVRGGIALRGVLVPVVDLPLLLGRPAAGVDPTIVVCVEHAGMILAIGADAVSSVFGAAAVGGLAAQSGDAGNALFAGSILPDGEATPISILSPESIATAAAAALIVDFEPQRRDAVEAVSAAQGGREGSQMLLVRAGANLLAIDALAVHSTLSSPRIEPTYLSRGHCLGVIEYLGCKMPAVDLGSLCGFEGLRDRSALQAFVLSMDAGMVACLVEEVLDVVGVVPGDLLPISDYTRTEMPLFSGILPTAGLAPDLLSRRHIEGTQFFVIDGTALKACVDIESLSRTNTSAQGPAAATVTAQSGQPRLADGRSIVTFDYGAEAAVPLDQVVEILSYDAPRADLKRTGGMLGLVISRGRAIPVVGLGRVLGMSPASIKPVTSVLVVEVDGGPVGFAVAALLGIERAVRETTLGRADGRAGLAAKDASSARHMVEIQSDAGPRLLRLLDLAAIAGGLRDRGEPLPLRASA